jgi:hypothetical protein
MRKRKLFLSFALLLAVIIAGAMGINWKASADEGVKCNCSVYQYDQRGRRHLIYHGVLVTVEIEDGRTITLCDGQECTNNELE